MQPANSSLLSRTGRKMTSRQAVIYFDYCNYWHCWAPYLCGGCTPLTASPFFLPSAPCDTSTLLISHPTCCRLEPESVICGNNIKHVHSQRETALGLENVGVDLVLSQEVCRHLCCPAAIGMGSMVEASYSGCMQVNKPIIK